MNKHSWSILFFCVLAADLLLIQLNQPVFRFFSKPLLMPLLAIYFYRQTGETNQPGLRKWTLIALFFSLLGDFLLMFQGRQEIFFIIGLSAFLLAHIFYIIAFHQIRVKEGINRNLWALFIVVLYYAIFTAWLSPYLGKMKLPVRLYGVIISFMFMLALHLLSMQTKKAGRLIMLGALLFVISDSLLAVNKFYESFFPGDILIMLSYGFAQFLIVTGMAMYIKQTNSNYI